MGGGCKKRREAIIRNTDALAQKIKEARRRQKQRREAAKNEKG